MTKCTSMLIVISVLLVALSGCKKELKTVVLKPDSKRFVYWQPGLGDAGAMPDGPVGIPCPSACFYTHGTSCDPKLTQDDSTIVGYSHAYDPGTQPCRCWWYVDCAYRGFVGFDVSSLKQYGIVSATLKWTPTTQRSVGDTATNEGSCIREMFHATEPWQTTRPTAGEPLGWNFAGEGVPHAPSVDVSSTVRGWVSGTIPNYGFFFVGPNENVHEQNNNVCLTKMEDLRLEVLVSVDSGP